MKKIYLIAEIGCNHNGSYKLAAKMIQKAVECGVDAIKFQTFKAEKLISKYAPKAEYQKKTTGSTESQLDMTKKLELSGEDYLKLKKLALSKGVDVFSTPFDMDSIDFLYEKEQHIWKIPSGEITNLPYLEKIGGLVCKKKQILLSTGMSTIEEINKAVGILERAGTDRKNITILHCNTEYPTPDEDVNISAILDLHRHFPDMNIGFSDHSVGSIAAVMAVGLNITMIEKHFTLDKNLLGPDHKASATPEELKKFCSNVRRAEYIRGLGKKIVTTSEQKNKIVARKSIVAGRKIKKGEVFSESNITCKRPGNGISPMYWYNILGTIAKRDFETDELIEQEGFLWEE